MEVSSTYELLLFLHSLLRMGILAACLIVLGLALKGLSAAAEPGALAGRTQLLLMIGVDLQVLMGVLLWMQSPLVASAREDMGAAMKDSETRYFLIEHGLTMLLLLVVVHVGRLLVKRAKDAVAANRRALIYSVLALVLLALRSPWPLLAPERPWLRLPFYE